MLRTNSPQTPSHLPKPLQLLPHHASPRLLHPSLPHTTHPPPHPHLPCAPTLTSSQTPAHALTVAETLFRGRQPVPRHPIPHPTPHATQPHTPISTHRSCAFRAKISARNLRHKMSSSSAASGAAEAAAADAGPESLSASAGSAAGGGRAMMMERPWVEKYRPLRVRGGVGVWGRGVGRDGCGVGWVVRGVWGERSVRSFEMLWGTSQSWRGCARSRSRAT
jgi:hypothetical protein